MPMAVPGDPEENERVLKRMADGLIAFRRKRAAQRRDYRRRNVEKERATQRAYYKNNPHVRERKLAYAREKMRTDVMTRARKRLRSMKTDYSRYQWAIKWEMALPRLVAKVMAERG